MNDTAKSSGGGPGKRFRRDFVAGLVVVVPIGAAILILAWIFNSIDSILKPLVIAIWGRSIPGIGFAAALVLIYLIGVITSNVIGKRILRYIEALLARVPVFRQFYIGIKQILESFSTPTKTGFMQVVLVEFPRKGMNAIGFVTNELHDNSGEKLLSILIPTAPNPTTGFLQIVKEKEVMRTRISVDDAIKMIVSAGRMTSDEVAARFPETGR